jgi:hypothetical protein
MRLTIEKQELRWCSTQRARKWEFPYIMSATGKKTYQARAVLNRSAFVERNLGLLLGIKIIKKQNRMEEPQCDSSCVLVIGLDMLDNQLGPSPAITQM